ncbi:MAG: RNA-guided pseudouridylation complex pseudouridine synthase subunit Cbf5 [Halobacteriaceae archaeon]
MSDTLRDPPGERDIPALLEFGVVPLDKPAGPSAHQVAAWVRDAVDEALESAGHAGIDRAAHAGTLDPKVTGCLPTLLGTGTRCVPALQHQPKEYVAVLELHGPAPADFEAVLAEFEGTLYQRPPRKSAVVRELRQRRVEQLEIIEQRDRQVLLHIDCEAGTYVRKLCHDIGLAAGTGAHMGDLRRIGTGPFDDRELVYLEDLVDGLAAWTEHGETDWLREAVRPAERALAHLPAVTIAPSAAREVAEGAPVYAPGVIDGGTAEQGQRVVCITPGGTAVCLGTLVGAPTADQGTVVELERVLV